MPRAAEESPLWGVIPYRVAVPVLLAAALALTVLLVVTLESWHSALTEAISLGSHPQDIPQADLLKVAVMVLLLGATALVSVYILQYYRNTQRRLAHVQQLSRNVLENIVTGVVTLDLDGSISIANPWAGQMLGLPSNPEGLDLRWLEAHHPTLGTVLRAAVEHDRHVQDKDISSVAPDGSVIWLRVTTTAMSGAEQHRGGVIAVVKDVTEMLTVERQLRRLDRLAVTESLAAGVAHEIRNPLTAIDLNLRVVRDEVTSGAPNWDEVNSHFEILTEETRRLNRITEQFLSFSRRNSAPHRALSLPKVVRRVLHLIASEAEEKQIQLETSIATDVGPVLGDAESLEQVVLNVLVNAMESMPDGGKIQVSVRNVPGNQNGDWIEVKVADQGPGFSDEHLVRLFDPYFTTKQNGTGLGLAIAHRIITDHDGEIGLENRTHGGAVAKIRLPGAPAQLGTRSDQIHESKPSTR